VDGAEAKYSANVIAENMWAQCDIDGKEYQLLDAIIDHKLDGHAVHRADSLVIVNGRKHMKKTTKGWQLCIQWKDGTTSLERLTALKESNPIEAAEYVIARGIEDKPAFAWWVNFTLKKRERMISAVVRVPKNAEEAYAIDKVNNNSLWADATAKEMKNVRVAFNVLEDNQVVPVGHQKIRCHGIYDIKMDGFSRKFRMVAGGHMMEAPARLTYARVVSQESVRVMLTIASLNDLQVKAGDIQNAYLTAPVTVERN
jgi:hypothetical protein